MAIHMIARRVILSGLIGLLLAAGLSGVSPVVQAAIPPYSSAWIEMNQPDLNTVFLWKFSSEKDRQTEVSSTLDQGDIGALLDNGKSAQDAVGGRVGQPPNLQGDARSVPDAGRFGGGLVLDGNGFAEGVAQLPDLLGTDGAFILDFWFRSSVSASRDGPATLLALADSGGRLLATVVKTNSAAITLRVDGQDRLSVPLTGGTGQWHHCALTVAAPRGQPEHPAIVLAIDGEKASVAPQDWTKSLNRRLGSTVMIGGAPGQPGWHGAVDEVRLTKGVRHFYPWNLGHQELERSRADLELTAPFFKSNKLLTRFRFDGSLQPEIFAGRSWKGSAEPRQFQRGVQGQALDLRPVDQSGFQMTGYSSLPEKNGTIEFWFRPLDWNNFYVGEFDGRGVKRDILMTLTAKDGKSASVVKELEVWRGRAGRDAELRWQQIHPGTWTHVLISLQDGQQSVYLNGQLQKFGQVELVTRGVAAAEAVKKWRERTGGNDDDDTWTLAFKPGATLVDEFSIYAGPLSAEEAWNAYARWLPDAAAQMKPLPVFRLDFDYFAHSFDMQEKLVAKLACRPVGDAKPVSADCEIRAADGAVLLNVAKQALDDSGNTTFILKQPLPFGRYPVIIRSRDAAGTVIKEEHHEYLREKPAWFGNTLGLEHTIPKPWTPIVVEGQKLRVIGRELELGANGLPARIETLKQQLFAAPTTIRVATSAGTAELTGQGAKITGAAPDRVAWQATLQGAGVTAALDAWMEFDGLIYCAITLQPAAGTEIKLDELTVNFPLNPAIATQLLANGGGQDFRASWIAKYIPPGDGSVWNSVAQPYPRFSRAKGVANFMPHIWVGGDEAGLYFGGENDRGWTVDGPKPAQEILRQDGAVVFRMNVIREPVTLAAAGRRFHFVLLPTPAKPEPSDWRKQMIVGGVNFGSCDSFGGFNLKTDPADAGANDSFLLEPRSWERAAILAPQCRAKWGRCILYADAAWPGLGPAFHDWRHDMWPGVARVAWTPEFEDYVVWSVNEYLKRGLIDGVYWDDVSVGQTLSLASTAYPEPGSENGRRVGFTALAQRRANLRLWRLFEAAGKEPCIWAHMTVCYEVPLFSFCRYLSNGEFVTGVEFGKTRDAMDFWNPATLRILGGSAKWGTGVSFLSTLPRSLPASAAARQWAYPQDRTESAIYITSDIMTLPVLATKLTQEHFFDETPRVWPWWKSGEVLTVAAPTNMQALAVVYAFEKRAIIAVASRDRGAEQDVRLELNTARLFPGAKNVAWRDLDPGLKPPVAVTASPAKIDKPDPVDAADLTDLLDGTTPESRALQRLELRTEGNTARVVVRPRDYRILEARPQP